MGVNMLRERNGFMWGGSMSICMGVWDMGMMWSCMAMQRWEGMEHMAWCRERKCGEKESEGKWVRW